MTERWAPVPGFIGFYEVSDMGRVRAVRRRIKAGRWGHEQRKQRMMSCTTGGRNYRKVTLCKLGTEKTLRVARLVLLAFVGPAPEGMQCCHNNGKSTDDRLENLRWDTPMANAADKARHGKQAEGVNAPRAKLTDAQVRTIRTTSETAEALAIQFGVSATSILNARHHRTYRNVQPTCLGPYCARCEQPRSVCGGRCG